MTLRKRECTGSKKKSHSVENSHWKRLWTCSKTDCGMNVYGVNCEVLLKAEDLLAT
jgi:hypothetical protein